MTGNGSFILCADDFALTDGVTAGVLALAEAGRLSATSAIVTTAHWPAHARLALRFRSRLAIGLHLNLTFDRPLGPMTVLAPDGNLPPLSRLIRLAATAAIDRGEIAAEITRQLERFESEIGFPPDFFDGHHHVHVLPVVRHAVLDVLQRRASTGRMLVRDPADSPLKIVRRRVASGKALSVAVLAFGFRALALRSGFPVNLGFSGYSTFGGTPYAEEFAAFLRYPGKRHIVMCHPGLVDDELGPADSIGRRRLEEYALLSTCPEIPNSIWRPDRSPIAPDCEWPG